MTPRWGSIAMTTDPQGEKEEETGSFEEVVDEIHAYLGNRNFVVSRMKLRSALVAYAAQEHLPPLSGAKVMQVLLTVNIFTPAQLIELA